MRSPLLKGSLGIPQLLLSLAVAAGAGAAACSEAAGSGDTNIVVDITMDAITIENRTGTALSKGEVSIVPQGFARPYTANLTYLPNGGKREISLNTFRMSDGSPFRRDVAKGKSVKVAARDVGGKAYDREVPFK